MCKIHPVCKNTEFNQGFFTLIGKMCISAYKILSVLAT